MFNATVSPLCGPNDELTWPDGQAPDYIAERGDIYLQPGAALLWHSLYSGLLLFCSSSGSSRLYQLRQDVCSN